MTQEITTIELAPASAALMDLIDAYAEQRHVSGCHTYNAKTQAVRNAVCAALTTALTAAPPVEQQGAYAELPDLGPWQVDLWPQGEIVLQSDDFHRDVALIVNGDFCDLADKRAYADAICAWMNDALRTRRQAPARATSHHYGIVDPDYARVFTQARIIAWQYGYACLMSGSFTRDLDLLLVPWTEQAGDNHDQLLKLIAESCGLRFRDGKDEVYESTVDFTDKPYGRKACSLFFKEPSDRRWIDISIVPRVVATAQQVAQGAVLDAKRLDWLEERGSVAIERCKYLGSDDPVIEVTPYNDDTYEGETLRKAIDAAIVAKEGKHESNR